MQTNESISSQFINEVSGPQESYQSIKPMNNALSGQSHLFKHFQTKSVSNTNQKSLSIANLKNIVHSPFLKDLKQKENIYQSKKQGEFSKRSSNVNSQPLVNENERKITAPTVTNNSQRKTNILNHSKNEILMTENPSLFKSNYEILGSRASRQSYEATNFAAMVLPKARRATEPQTIQRLEESELKVDYTLEVSILNKKSLKMKQIHNRSTSPQKAEANMGSLSIPKSSLTLQKSCLPGQKDGQTRIKTKTEDCKESKLLSKHILLHKDQSSLFDQSTINNQKSEKVNLQRIPNVLSAIKNKSAINSPINSQQVRQCHENQSFGEIAEYCIVGAHLETSSCIALPDLLTTHQEQMQLMNREQVSGTTGAPIMKGILSRSRKSKFFRQKTQEKKEMKLQGWPSEDIPNLYAQSTLQYKNSDSSEKVAKTIFKSESGSLTTGQTEIDENRDKKNIIKKSYKQIDKLYKLPLGEQKASEKLKQFKKKTQIDISKARMVAKTEIKFREFFETIDVPEFKILPNPSSLFQEEKAIEKIEEIGANTTVKQSNNVFRNMSEICSIYGGTQTTRSIQPNPSSNLQTAAGFLSNNIKNSNLMLHIKKQQKLKMKELIRIQRFKQRYMISPSKSRRSTERAGESFDTSFMRFNESFLTNPLAHRAESFDSINTNDHNATIIEENVQIPESLDLSSEEQEEKQQVVKNRKLKGTIMLHNLTAKTKKLAQPVSQLKVKNSGGNKDQVQIKKYPGIDLQSDPINTTQRLYKEVILIAISKAQDFYDQKEIQPCTDMLMSVIPLAQFALELFDTLMLYKLIGSVYYQSKNYKTALEEFHLIVYMCSDKDLLSKIRQDSLRMAALCRMHLKQYLEALHEWKLCLEHCFRMDDQEGEGQVYEQMSYCYFYLGQMKKAEYFNTRFRMGIYEEEDSQIRLIYKTLRNSSNKRKRWNAEVQYVTDHDLNWQGETLFRLFYDNLLDDCHNKERICNRLRQGQINPVFPPRICQMSKDLAVAILRKVGKLLKKTGQKRIKVESTQETEIFLGSKWRQSYHLTRRLKECEEIVNLRVQIYKVCLQKDLTEYLPSELQFELELIGDYLQAQENMLLDQKNNTIVRITKLPQNKLNMLKVPNLGSISYEDYDLQEMPSPTVARIDDHRFDFKASLRNADFRNHKQYESEEIKEIYPNLYYKKFKKEPVPRQFQKELVKRELPDINDPLYKHKLILRAKLRKTKIRDLIFMSHLSQDRNCFAKFSSDVDRKRYQFRHFTELKTLLRAQLTQIQKEQAEKTAGSDQIQSHTLSPVSRTQNIRGGHSNENVVGLCSQPHSLEQPDRIDVKMPIKEQLRIVKATIINCLPLRAYIYGQDLVRELICDHNKVIVKRKLKKEKSNIDFTKAAGLEKKPSLTFNMMHAENAFITGSQNTVEQITAAKIGQDLKQLKLQKDVSNRTGLGSEGVKAKKVTSLAKLNFPTHSILKTPKMQKSRQFSLSPEYNTSSFASNEEITEHKSVITTENKNITPSQSSRFKQVQTSNIKTHSSLLKRKLTLNEVIHEEDNETTIKRIQEKTSEYVLQAVNESKIFQEYTTPMNAVAVMHSTKANTAVKNTLSTFRLTTEDASAKSLKKVLRIQSPQKQQILRVSKSQRNIQLRQTTPLTLELLEEEEQN